MGMSGLGREGSLGPQCRSSLGAAPSATLCTAHTGTPAGVHALRTVEGRCAGRRFRDTKCWQTRDEATHSSLRGWPRLRDQVWDVRPDFTSCSPHQAVYDTSQPRFLAHRVQCSSDRKSHKRGC